MNLVKKLDKHTIYYYCDDKIKYYINVPHKEFNTTNISLEFLEDTKKYDLEFNDIEWVKSNIIEYYEKVDNDNITLILPILKKEEKDNLLSLNINKLNLIERLMALYINSGYIALTRNKINVNKEVFLIENDKYINFIKYFKDKHNSRIVVKRLIEINDNLDEKINKIDIKTKPFSINENILSEVLNINDKENNNEKITIENNISINKKNNITPTNSLKNTKDELTIQNDKIENDNLNKTVNLELDVKGEKNNIIKQKGINSNNNSMTVSKIKSDLNNSNDNKKEEIKVNKIINPTEKKEDIEKKNDSVNNVINISDLRSLTAGGLNGSLPGNVTINIEKLVTENNDPIKSSKNVEEDIDEVSELDEDISDVDEFDENEDFDLDAIDVSEAVLSSDDGNKTYRTVTSGGIKFVVGRKDDENFKPIEINKNNSIDLNANQNLKIDMPTNIVKGDDQINKNAGFASYFTLFFVAISAIFVILYIIIK